MKSSTFFSYENFKIGKFSELLKAKFQSIEKSSNAKVLREEITSIKFVDKLKVLVKNDLDKTIEPIL